MLSVRPVFNTGFSGYPEYSVNRVIEVQAVHVSNGYIDYDDLENFLQQEEVPDCDDVLVYPFVSVRKRA